MDDMQDATQEKFVHLAGSFRKNQGKPEFEKEVNECIQNWERILNEYVHGKAADTNDQNVFALYYNRSL